VPRHFNGVGFSSWTNSWRLEQEIHTCGDSLNIDELRTPEAESTKEIAPALNPEGVLSPQNCAFKGNNVCRLRLFGPLDKC
jgi:hypothetical protein